MWRGRLYQLHRWLAMTCGGLLLVVCLSGTLATLGPLIDDWLEPPTPAAAPVPALATPDLDAMVRAVAAAFPGMRVERLVAGPSPAAPWRVELVFGDGRAGLALVDPVGARVLGTRGFVTAGSVLRTFHRQLFLPMPWGLYLVSAIGLVLTGLLITGLVVCRRLLSGLLRLRTGRGLAPLLSDGHRLAAGWFLWFLPVIALTAVWFLIERCLLDAGWFPEIAPPRLSASELAAHGPTPRPLPLNRLAAAARDALPGLTIATLTLPGRSDGPVMVAGSAEAWVFQVPANRVWLDPYDAAVRRLDRVEGLDWPERLAATARPLHFGSFAGVSGRIVWCLSGLALLVLIVTGLWQGTCRRRAGRGSRAVPWGLVPVSVVLVALWRAAAAIAAGEMPPTPMAKVLADAPLGPWRVEVAVGPPVPGVPRLYRVTVACPGDCRPNLRRLTLTLVNEAGRRLAEGAVEAEPVVQRRISLEPGMAAALTVVAETWDGRRFEVGASLPSA